MVEQGFFSYLTQTRDFQRFESELDKYISTLSHDNETLFLCERIKNILTTMADAPKVYDGAHFNINVIGSRFRDLITNIEIKNNTESVFFMFYRFYQEIKFTLSINDQSVFSISTSNVDEVIDDALEKLSERNKKLITWVRYLMPAYMLDESVKKLPEIQHFNSLFQNLETTKKELDEVSPYTFEYTPLKTGRKITAIKFYPVYQPEHRDSDLEKHDLQKQTALSWSLAPEIRSYLKNSIEFSDKEIKNNLDLFISAQTLLPDFLNELAILKGKSREKKNPKGYIINAIKGKIKDRKKL